jgi:hypothetical protein
MAPRRASSPTSARLSLTSTTVKAGGAISGHITVENNTGRAIRVTGCGGIFQVLLTSGTYHPTVAWLACLQSFTIPIGQSSDPVRVDASYSECDPGRHSRSTPECLGEGPPPLPPGWYKATTFELGNAVAIPPPIMVRVAA